MSRILVACHDCDVVQHDISLKPGKVAHCICCGATLYRAPVDSLNRSLAFTLAAAIAFILANVYPLLFIQVRGSANHARLIDTVLGLYMQGRPFVASLVLVTTMIVPAATIFCMLYVLIPLHFYTIPRHFKRAFRLALAIKPWGMIEVFMIGMLVSFAKLSHVADTTPGIGLYSFAILMLALAASSATFEPRDIWNRVEMIYCEWCDENDYSKIKLPS